MPIQTSVSTLPIPVIWGTARIAPNLIWYGDFTNNDNGGKASNKGKSSNTGYTASIVLALCEGPIDGISKVFVDQQVTDLSSVGLGPLQGYTPEEIWSYLETAHPSNAYSYNGTACLVAENYNLGSSPVIPSHGFAVDKYTGFAVTWGVGVPNPVDLALVIQDFLTNPQYGVQNFPSSSIDSATLLSSSAATTTGDAATQTYLRAIGLPFDIAITSVEKANSILARWLQLANVAAVWSGTSLKFIPYGDQPVSGNGVVYQPNLTPVYALDDDDFIWDDRADPVQITVSDPLAAYNIVRVEVTTNDGYFSNVPVEVRDQANIDQYGPRIMPTITGHEICSTYYGQVSAQLILQRQLYVRNTYTFKLGIEFSLLEPMDLVTLTDPLIGLNSTIVRITAVEEDEDGTMSFTAEEFPEGAGTANSYPTASPSFTVPNAASEPEPANPPIIYEPNALLVDTPEIWFAVSGGSASSGGGAVADPNWGGCQVWLSVDGGTTYPYQLGTISGTTPMGILTANLPAISGADPDTTHTLAVSMAQSGKSLATGTDQQADLDITLCYVGPTAGNSGTPELLAYGNASLTGANAYNLTYLQRGLFGTGAGSHASGLAFARLDGTVFKYALPANLVGVELYFKFVGFNLFGLGVQDISSCTAYAYTPTGVAFSDGAVTIAPASGASVAYPATAQSLVLNPSAALASLTITLPAYPANNQTAEIFASKAVTALTIDGNTGQTVDNAPTSLAANTGFTLTYSAASSTWTRSA